MRLLLVRDDLLWAAVLGKRGKILTLMMKHSHFHTSADRETGWVTSKVSFEWTFGFHYTNTELLLRFYVNATVDRVYLHSRAWSNTASLVRETLASTTRGTGIHLAVSLARLFVHPGDLSRPCKDKDKKIKTYIDQFKWALITRMLPSIKIQFY